MRGGNLPTPKPVVTIQDVFGTYTATLKEADRMCAPSNKNNEDPAAPTRPQHLAGYEFVRTTPNVAEPNDVSVTNQLGSYVVNVRNPYKLLVPSSKSLTAPAPPPLAPGVIPHFICHDLSNVRGPRPSGISVVSQFASNTVGVGNLNRATLCAPTNKNGEEPGAVTNPNFLMCFHTNELLNFGTLTVYFTNQLGPSTSQFTGGLPFITQYDELCVPSTVTLP